MLFHSFWHKAGPLSNTDPMIKTIMFSDLFFWSAWSTILPILSIFTIKEIADATIQTAAVGYSLYLIIRVLGTMLSGILFNKVPEAYRVTIIMAAICILNVSYIGFAFMRTPTMFLLFYSLIGLGVGMAAPIRAALFSKHLDKKHETTEWALLDSIILIGVAICTLIAGLLITNYGFTVLFLSAVIFNCLSIGPYLVYRFRYLKT